MNAPDPRSAVHCSIAPPPLHPPIPDTPAPALRRPSGWPTAAALALIVLLLSIYVATLHSSPRAEATRVSATTPGAPR